MTTNPGGVLAAQLQRALRHRDRQPLLPVGRWGNRLSACPPLVLRTLRCQPGLHWSRRTGAVLHPRGPAEATAGEGCLTGVELPGVLVTKDPRV